MEVINCDIASSKKKWAQSSKARFLEVKMSVRAGGFRWNSSIITLRGFEFGIKKNLEFLGAGWSCIECRQKLLSFLMSLRKSSLSMAWHRNPDWRAQSLMTLLTAPISIDIRLHQRRSLSFWKHIIPWFNQNSFRVSSISSSFNSISPVAHTLVVFFWLFVSGK